MCGVVYLTRLQFSPRLQPSLSISKRQLSNCTAFPTPVRESPLLRLAIPSEKQCENVGFYRILEFPPYSATQALINIHHFCSRKVLLVKNSRVPRDHRLPQPFLQLNKKTKKNARRLKTPLHYKPCNPLQGLPVWVPHPRINSLLSFRA